jgi:Phage capsid family
MPLTLDERLHAAETALAEIQRQKAAGFPGGGPTTGSRAGSDEQRLLGAFRAKSIPHLLRTNIGHPMFAHVDPGLKAAALCLKRDFDIARLWAQISTGEGIERMERTDRDQEIFSAAPACKSIGSTGVWKNLDLEARLKAFGTGVAGAGLEWIPTAISANYIEEYELDRKLVGVFKKIDMPTNPYKQSFAKQVTRARRVAEGGEATDSQFGTDTITFDAEKLFEYYKLPEELNEDSAPNILQLGRDQVIQSQGRAVEDTILNGDNSGTHMDSDVTGVVDNRTAWKGLRKYALDNSANGTVVDFLGAGPSKTKLDEMRVAMGKFGVDVSELGWIFGSTGYIKASNIDEVTTVEKFGPNATILKGALAAFRGIPILVSEFVREDLNDSGVYDGATTDRTFVLLANLKRWYVGMRRPIRVTAKPDPRPEFDRWQLVSYQRIDFKGHPQTATEKSVVIGVDVLI